jgi:hypothetical protein
LSYTARKKNSGRLLYRNGIDLLSSLHLHIVEHYHTVDRMQTETNIFNKKNAALISENNRKSHRGL